MATPRQAIDNQREDVSKGRLDDTTREASPLDFEDEESFDELDEDDLDY